MRSSPPDTRPAGFGRQRNGRAQGRDADGLTGEHMHLHQDHLPIHPTLTHPRTGLPLQAVGIVQGRPVWPVLGAEDPPEGGPKGDPPEYTPPATQEEFDRMVQDRVRRAEKKGYGEAEGKYKPKADRHDELEAQLGSEADKAAKKAADEARQAATGEYAPRLVKQAFKAEAKGVLTTEQLDALLEDLELTKYLDKDGDVDEEKVTKKVAAFAPKKGDDKDDQRHRGLGQGHHPPAGAKPGDGGRAQGQKRFGDRANSARQSAQ